ncbi:MAG: ATP-binding protein [Negativicutes bacterium]|nr:ATP-binding protein [Negativicutes bacterium]
MMIRPRSIYFRHLISHLLVILFLVLAMGGLLTFVIYHGNGPPALHKRASDVAEILGSTSDPSPIPDARTWQLLGKAANATLWLTDTSGNVIGGSPPEGWSQNPTGRNGFSPSSPTSDNKLLQTASTVAVPTQMAGKPAILYAAQEGNTLRLMGIGRIIFLIPFLVGILAAIVLGLLLSRSLTKSIADIATAAAHFSSGDYTSRTTTTGNDELGDLGKNLNAMADSITRSEQTRREFYANISHELKTPLSCIQAITEALIDGIAKTPDDHQQYLRKIHSETLRMSRMIHDLLDLEQLEAGKLTVRRDRVDIQALLSEQADKIQDLLKAKNLSLVLRLETEKHFIWGDPDRLIQVFDNLLSNAIRHAPQGSRISIAMLEENDKVKVSIADQGEGMSVDELPLIWDRFYRTDKSRDRASGGNGLGLPITRSLVEAMGGVIFADSVKNQGTTFTIEFLSA